MPLKRQPIDPCSQVNRSHCRSTTAGCSRLREVSSRMHPLAEGNHPCRAQTWVQDMRIGSTPTDS
jgi:hypothetical protein